MIEHIPLGAKRRTFHDLAGPAGEKEQDRARARTRRDPYRTGSRNIERLKRAGVYLAYCAATDKGGDELLVEVAKLLTSMARSNDAIGRIGGDEFVIVCDGLTRPHTINLIARLGDALDVGLGVRISVGVAGSRAGGSATDLLARADRAMYDNKRRINRRLEDGPHLH